MIIDINKLQEWNRLSKETKDDPLFIGEIAKEMPKVPVLTLDGDTYAHKLVREGIVICHLIRIEFEKSPEVRDTKSHKVIEDAKFFTLEEKYIFERSRWSRSATHFNKEEKDKFTLYKEALDLCFDSDKVYKHNNEQYQWVWGYLELINFKELHGENNEEKNQRKIFIDLNEDEYKELYQAFYSERNDTPTIEDFVSFLNGYQGSQVRQIPKPLHQNMIHMLRFWNKNGIRYEGLVKKEIKACQFETYAKEVFGGLATVKTRKDQLLTKNEQRLANVIDSIKKTRKSGL
jgi:hypothetical protein